MKKSLLFTLFFTCSPVLLAARVFQQFYMLDPVTGFYTANLSGMGGFITAICLAIIPLLLIVVWLSKPAEIAPAKRSISVGIGAAVAAVLLAASGVMGLLNADDMGQSVIAVLSIASAAVFAWQAFCCFTGGSFDGAFSLVPIAYGLARLVITFMGYAGEVTITDTVFDIATMCMLLLFLYSCGKIQAGVSGKRTAVLFFAFGLTAVFFCTDSFLAQTVASIMGNDFKLHASGNFDPSYLGFAIYIVTVLFAYGPKRDEQQG